MTRAESASALVVMPYWSFFEESTTLDLYRDREQLLRRVVDSVSVSGVTVGAVALLESIEDANDVLTRADQQSVDVLVVASSMAAPPIPVLHLIRGLPTTPVVIWPCAWPAQRLDGFSHADIVERGATVGTPMITSVLVREGRAFALLPVDLDVDRPGPVLAEEIAAAVTASRLRRARIARLGDPLSGYESLVVQDDVLETGTGVCLVRLDESEFTGSFQRVSVSRARARAKEITESTIIDCREDLLLEAARSVEALESLVTSADIDAGTLNCHCPGIRQSPEVAHAPCLALGVSTSRGVPWTCTGDVLTAVAMLFCSLVSGTSLYHEIEAFDPSSGEFVLANSGEHDTRWSDQTARIVQSPWWPRSVCAVHPLTQGPATLVALCPTPDGLRLLAAEGNVTSDSEPATGTTSARFTWPGREAAAGWARWVEAGAGHHAALGRGHLADQLGRVAHHLDLDVRLAP